MISSLSVGDVIDLKPSGGYLISTSGFPSYPTTLLVVSEPEKTFDRYWNQFVWLVDTIDLSTGSSQTFVIFKHKWDKIC